MPAKNSGDGLCETGMALVGVLHLCWIECGVTVQDAMIRIRLDWMTG